MPRNNAAAERYELINIFGAPALFTESRIDRRTVPKELHFYEVRHDDDKGNPIEIGTTVLVNFFGSVITATEIDGVDPTSSRNTFRKIKSKNWKYTGHAIGIDEYLDIARCISNYRRTLMKESGILNRYKEENTMSKSNATMSYEERVAAREAKRVMHKRMYRVKIEVQTDRKALRYGVSKKIYFRDKAAALECQAKYEEALKQAVFGSAAAVDIEGTVVRSNIITTYKVKLREPEQVDNPEIPDKLIEDDDD